MNPTEGHVMTYEMLDKNLYQYFQISSREMNLKNFSILRFSTIT